MKKITRKALLTAKLYRPGKAGGGSTKKKKYTLVPDVPRREVRAISPTGSEVGYLSMEKYGDAAKNNEAFNMAVKPAWQRQGIMTALHDEAEKHFGTINPSRLLSDDGFAFWKAYRPDAVRNSYRFHADRLMGKPVSTSKGDGVISSINDSVMIAKKDDGSTFLVPDEISDQMFKQAQAEAAQEQQPEDDINKAAGGRTGYGTGGRPTNAFGMYSKGAEVARALPQKKASGAQMLTMLADPKRGVKREELVNAGLLTPEGKPHPDWANRTVTSDELAQHLEASLPKVAETSYGATHGYPYKYAVDWHNAIEKARKAKDKDEVARLTKAWGESMISESEPPRFQRYSLPGGEGYRERLWHLDEGDGGYQSSHWDGDRTHKPVSDVLAHARMKDRTGPNGEKILHVEELQSDWGQEGRDQGFLTPENTEKRNAWQQKFYDLQRAKFAADDAVEKRYDELSRIINHSDPEYHAKMLSDEQWKALKEQQKQAKAAYEAHHDTMPQSDLIPTGPYVGSTEGWTDLALKRVLQEAVKGGYDKLVISPGEANADLYGQRRHVNTLVYRPHEKILQHYSDKDGAGNFPHEIKPEELPKHIGSDLAQKLLSQPLEGDRHTLGGLDDIIGGQGMKKYYNRDVPQRLSKLVKGMDPDAQVGVHDFDLPAGAHALDDADSYKGHSLDITDKIRDAVNQGLPAFRRGGMAGEPDEEGKIYDPTDRDTNLGHFLHGSKVRNKSGDHVPVYHITPKSFSKFKPGGDDQTQSGPVIFLSPNREYLPAGHNAGGEKWGYKEGANVMPLWVNLRNPLMLDDYGKAREVMNRLKLNNAFPYFFTPEDRQALIDEGYDGVINGFSGLSGIPQVPYEPGKVGVGDQPHREEEIVAFHPNQVKSAIGNRGTYDRDEDDINKAEGGEVDDDSHKDALEDFYGPTADEHRGRWYTGTSKDKDFTAFQESRHGTWLTRDPEDASQYAMQNDSQDYKPDPSPGAKPWAMVKTNTASRVIPAFARVENPYRGDKPEWVMNTNNYKKAQSDWFDQLRSQGYDAWAPDSLKNVLVVLKNQGTNIKSAIGNSGAYDRSKKHLAKSEGGLIVDKAMALARNLTRR